jgi:hypothetical protein
LRGCTIIDAPPFSESAGREEATQPEDDGTARVFFGTTHDPRGRRFERIATVGWRLGGLLDSSLCVCVFYYHSRINVDICTSAETLFMSGIRRTNISLLQSTMSY